MFSELALGNCTANCVLNIEHNIPLYDNIRSRSPLNRKLTSAASCPNLPRQRSAVTVNSYAYSESKATELLLPKTYVTRKGDLLLFAVIDNELFALVDSANKSSKEAKERNGIFGNNPETLTQFGSLEEFVLAIIDYTHKKEKHLYASATKKFTQFITQSSLKNKPKKNKAARWHSTKEANNHEDKVSSFQTENHKTEGSNQGTRVTVGSSIQMTVVDNNNGRTSIDEIQEEKGHKFDSLALPDNRSTQLRGKIRSPLLERKSNTQKQREGSHMKEYLNFSMRMEGKNLENLSKHSLLKNSRIIPSYLSNDEKEEFLFSVNSYTKDDNNNDIAGMYDKVSSLLEADSRNELSYLTQRADSRVQTRGIINGKSKIQKSNTVLPFVFDGRSARRRGRSAMARPRKSSAVQDSNRLRSMSLQDLSNVNINPRISSARPAPEKRALGVTPSAISFSSEEFSRFIQVESTNRFSLKFPNSNETPTRQRSPGVDSLEAWQTEALRNQYEVWNTEEFDPIIRQGSLLSIAQANRRLGLDSEGNELSDRPGSFRDSLSSFQLGGMDDDEDRILFSYISPGLRKGSWNPTLSFSFEGSSGEKSKDGAFSKESTFMKDGTFMKEWTFSDEGTFSKERTFSKDGALFNERTFSNFEKSTFSNKGNLSREGTFSKERTASKDGTIGKEGTFSSDPRARVAKDDTAASGVQNNGENYALNHENTNLSGRQSTVYMNEDLRSDEKHVRSEQVAGINQDRLSPSGKAEDLHEVLNIWPLSPKPGENPLGNASSEIPPNGDDYEKELIHGHKSRPEIVPSTEINEEMDRKHVSFSANRDYSDEILKENFSEGPGDSLYRESSFASNTATNISVRNSIADTKALAENEASVEEEFSVVSDQAGHSDGTGSRGPSPWKGTDSIEDKSAFEASGEAKKPNRFSSVERKHSNSHPVEGNLVLQENVVGNGLNIREDSKMRTDAISEELKKNQQNFSYNESVFAAKQLRDNENEASYAGKIMPKRSHEAEKTGRLENSQNEIAADDLDKLESGVEIKVDEAVTMSSFMKTDNEKKRDKVIRNAKKAARKYPERPDKQTVELKIDLKVAEDSSPDISSSEARKSLPSLHNIEKDVVREDKTPLRLDGVGGGEEKDEDSLDDLKTLLQLNKTVEDPAKLKKKQTDKGLAKRVGAKQKKKRGLPNRQGSISKKGADSKNLSPVLDLPKKMETVETMIGRPKQSDNLLKPSPDTEPEAIIEREVTFENQLEIKESARNIAVQNVEVKKITEVDPEKKGAYPPSKPKRGAKRGVKKAGNGNKEQAQDKLKYEEQMRLLKEKEIEQQRAREAAMAKQKILEQEREKYKEDEEEAKKKEDEARKRLADAKVKAKEEREAKRLADAEKRRQLVEQRREERRQKELELAEKDKEAERMKFERERREQELKEQRERFKEQERIEEEQLLKNERLEELRREEEEKRLEEERIRKAQEELERLVEEREYREQLRRVAEAQELKMREAEEQRRLQEEREQQKIAEERERIKRAEYLKLQAELERQKEAENLADERRQMMLLKAAKRKAELIKRREENMERLFDLKCKRNSQGISRSFTFTYFVHIPRSVWELPIGWNSKKGKGGMRGKNRPISVATSIRGSK